MIFDVVFPIFYSCSLSLWERAISLLFRFVRLFRCFEEIFASSNFCNGCHGDGTFIHSILKMERKHVSRIAFLVYFTSYFMLVVIAQMALFGRQSNQRIGKISNKITLRLVCSSSSKSTHTYTFDMHGIVKYRWRKLPSCMICNELSIYILFSPAMHSIQSSQNLKLSTATAREK